MASIFLESVDETPGEPTRHVVAPPATVGRGAECDLRLDPANRALSRVHLEVVEADGGLVVVNRASNPGTTRLGDRVLEHDARIAVPETGALVFDLMSVEVRIGRAGALSVAASFAADGTPSEDLGLNLLADGRAVLLRAGPPARAEAIAPDAWAPPGPDAAPEAQLAVYLDRGQPTLAVLGRVPGRPVLIDDAELTTDSAYLRPLETVRHAGLVIELREAGLDWRRCPRCAALNAAGRAACRICGTDFAADAVEEEVDGTVVVTGHGAAAAAGDTGD
jgi:hypothetical protein